jgi:hypothetical protein
MNTQFHLHDVVVLLEDIPAKHFATAQPLLLRRDQIGTIVMTYDGSVFEFSRSTSPIQRDVLMY